MSESSDDLRAAVEVATRMATDARLLVRYCREYAALIAPSDPLVLALQTLALQAGASVQAIVRVCEGRETKLRDEHEH